jgi:hypothetical protein
MCGYQICLDDPLVGDFVYGLPLEEVVDLVVGDAVGVFVRSATRLTDPLAKGAGFGSGFTVSCPARTRAQARSVVELSLEQSWGSQQGGPTSPGIAPE